MENATNETKKYMFNCRFDPSAAEMIDSLSENPSALIMLVVACVITAVQMAVMIEGVIWIARNIPHSERSTAMMWLYAVWPVFAMMSLVGLFIPKAALVANTAASIFLCPAVYNFLSINVDYFGGQDAMISKMKDHPIPFHTPPCLCCFRCFGGCTGTINKKLLYKYEILVMQLAVFQPLLRLLTQVFTMDGSYPMYNTTDFTTPVPYLTLLTVISTFTAMQVINILQRSTSNILSAFSTKPKFLIVQFALLSINLQSAIINLILMPGGCGNPYPYKSRKYVWDCFMIILWSVVFQFMAIKYLRTQKGNTSSLPPMPPKIHRSASYSGKPARAEEKGLNAVEEGEDEEAEVAEELDEVSPLMFKRTRSTSDLEKMGSKTYGTVLTL